MTTTRTAESARARAAGCSPLICGDGNHNESAGRDRRSTRRTRALTGLAVAAAGVATVGLAGVDPLLARIAVNHNEAAGRDR